VAAGACLAFLQYVVYDVYDDVNYRDDGGGVDVAEVVKFDESC